MRQIAAILLAIGAIPCLARAQTRCGPGVGRTVLIHGVGHAFTVSAPTGWVAQAGFPDQPAPALLYPDGQTWRDAPAVMYVNTVLPQAGRTASLIAVMHADSAKFQTKYPAMQIDSLPPTHTADGRLVRFRKFAGAGYGSIDVVAYVAERTVTPLVVLSTRTQVELGRALPAFRALLRSYHYVATRLAQTSRLPCGAA